MSCIIPNEQYSQWRNKEELVVKGAAADSQELCRLVLYCGSVVNVLNLENTAVSILQCKTSYFSKMSHAKSWIKNGTWDLLRCSILMKYVFNLSDFSINCLEKWEWFGGERVLCSWGKSHFAYLQILTLSWAL